MLGPCSRWPRPRPRPVTLDCVLPRRRSSSGPCRPACRSSTCVRSRRRSSRPSSRRATATGRRPRRCPSWPGRSGRRPTRLPAVAPTGRGRRPTLTYENGIVPRALLRAGDRLADRVDGRSRTPPPRLARRRPDRSEGHFSPIGNRGWWPRGGPRARYDQQPIEATALLLAAEAAFEVTGGPSHRATMEWAYGWFLGRNDARRRVALPETGACHDGLTPTGVNANQGAESTLMWLIALERIRAARQPRTGRREARFVPGASAATPA